MKGWDETALANLAIKRAKTAIGAANANNTATPPPSKRKQPTKQNKAETANAITKNVLRIINLQTGCAAWRVNNVGVWDEKKKVRRKGNTEKGLPDIWACIRGAFVVIEVKAGSDKLSDDQKKRRFEVERAKGVYFEARSTDEFLKWFENLLSS